MLHSVRKLTKLWSSLMPSEPVRPARARSAEEKNQRRDDILRAAERLWTSTTYAELSMNQVAREAKLAKGTLYLYFDIPPLSLLISLVPWYCGVVFCQRHPVARRRRHPALIPFVDP